MKSLPILLALLALSAPCLARVVDGVAAVVDGTVITRSEVDETLRTRERLGPPRGKDPRADALDALIDKTLMAKEAERLGLAATDADVEAAAGEVRRRNAMDEATFRAAIEGQGLDYADYLIELRGQILRAKLAGQVLRSRARSDDGAVREFFLKHAGDYSAPTRVRLGHAAFGDRAAAEEARRRLAAGEAPTAAAPGYEDMGFVDVGGLSDEVRGALQGVEPGGVAPVAELAGSFHVFTVVEAIKGGAPRYEDLSEEQRQAVRNRFMDEQEEELYRTWMDSLRQKAKIERPGS